jgi:hypothetical protein
MEIWIITIIIMELCFTGRRLQLAGEITVVVVAVVVGHLDNARYPLTCPHPHPPAATLTTPPTTALRTPT